MSSSVIGVDLGGTKVAACSLANGSLGEPVVAPTDRSGSGALIDQLVEVVREARRDELEAVGIGVPSAVDFQSGSVVSSANIPLADVPLRDVLQERLGVPAFVDNDANVAALAEAHDDNLRLRARNLVMMTLGTGVGCGLVLGGRIYRGATGGAGELGHIIVGMDLEDGAAEPVRFPQPWSLEWVASGNALDRLGTEAAAGAPDSALGRIHAHGEKIDGRAVDRAAFDGDPVALRTIETWAERVGIGIANVINVFDPDEVVIGGGAAAGARELLLEPARRVALGYVLPGIGRRTQIRLARYGNEAGMLGAVLLALQELEDAAVGRRGAIQPSASLTEGGA